MNLFKCFPLELYREIICWMDPEDILALRKTCKYFSVLSQDPRLWNAVHDRMRGTHPLACSRTEFAALSTRQSERFLVRASITEKRFQTFREHSQHHIVPYGQTRKIGPLTALTFLSERFILSADDTTVVYVWDMSKLSSADAPSFPCARLTLVGWHFITYSMTIDESTLYVVLINGTRAHIFSLSLPMGDTDEPKLAFRNVGYFDTRHNDVKSIDADSCLVLLEVTTTIIEVLNWRTEDRSSFPLHEHENVIEGPPINYILAVRIYGPYILCFRHQSIEAYPIPIQFMKSEAELGTLPILQRTMVGMHFSAQISLSRVCHSQTPSGGVYTICALAENHRHGMFHYQVRLHLSDDPSLSVQLLGFEGAQTCKQISAWDLGTTGHRGLWVLAPNARGERQVVAFTRYPAQYEPFPSDEGTLDVPDEIAPQIGGEVVSVTSWKDSDVTRCAVSEFSGRIALGCETGAITLL